MEHAQSHNVSRTKPADIYRTFFRHFISEHRSSIYKCNLCNYTYGNWFHAMEHTKDSKHNKNWSLTDASTANYAFYQNTMDQFHLLVSNRIFIGGSKPYECRTCDLSFDNIAAVSKHVKEIEHINLRVRFTTEVSVCKFKIPEEFKWIKDSAFMVVMSDKIYCKKCNIYIVESKDIEAHMKGHFERSGTSFSECKTQANLRNTESESSKPVGTECPGPSIPLVECKLKIPNYLKWVISAHKVIIRPKELYCVICKKTLNNDSAVETHLKKHLKPSWQDENLPPDIPRDVKSARLMETFGQDKISEKNRAPISSQAGPSVTRKKSEAAGTTETAKRTMMNSNGSEQAKIQKISNYLEPHFFKNVGNYIQILPQKSQTVNNPPSDKRPPLLSTPRIPGISRFSAPTNQMSTSSSRPLLSTQRHGSIGILGDRPALLSTPFPRNTSKHPFQTRPNLIDVARQIPPLMSKPITKIPPAKVNQPINNQTTKNPINNPLINHYPKNNPVTRWSSPSLPSNNPLLNHSMMVKLHKANYLFFNKNDIYNMSLEKKRRITLSAHLSFFIKYSSDYFIYCVVCEKSIPYNLQNVYEHWCAAEHSAFLSKMENDDIRFSAFPTQYSCLALSKEFMIENRGSELPPDSPLREFTCCACDVTVQDDDSLLRQHFHGKIHISNVQRLRRHSEEMCKDLLPLVESTWYSIEKYSCWPCQKILTNEVPYADHLESKKHVTTLQAMTPEKRKKYSFDSCAVCGILWFGDQDEFSKHCYHDKIHKELTRSIEDRVDHLPEEASNLCYLAEEKIAELIAEANKLSQDRGRESELIRSLELAARRKFPDAKAHPFGSRISGLAFPSSDIDIFLDCGGIYNNQLTHSVDLIDKIHHCLKLDSQAWVVERVIESSRTPIIKVYHSHSQLKCDVSFTNGLSVENTRLLKSYLDAYPPCREIILFIKKWLSFCGLSGSRNITNYSISWFVIFYLQLKKILPSVASLLNDNPDKKAISGWKVGIKQFSIKQVSPELTTKELLKGFFSYYAEFDYRFKVACPLLGIVLSKKDFLYLPLLPDEMKSYVEHVTTDSDPEFLRIDSPMCIQDPYDLSHNLTKRVKKIIVNRFRKLCEKSARILSSNQ